MSVLPRLLGDQEVSDGDLSQTAAVLRALSHPARLRLLRHLAHAPGQIATVGQLARRMDLAHSTVSQHLARLAVMGLITKHPPAATRPSASWPPRPWPAWPPSSPPPTRRRRHEHRPAQPVHARQSRPHPHHAHRRPGQ